MLDEDTHPVIRTKEYHTQVANMSFDKIFELIAGLYCNIYNTV